LRTAIDHHGYVDTGKQLLGSQHLTSMRRLPILTALTILLMAAACGGGGPSRPVEWALTAEPDGSTVRVRAEFGGSSCTDFDEWQVEETSTEVEVTAVVTFSGAADCTADLVSEPYTVRLAVPLGNRRLVGCDPESAAANCATVATP